jgi:5-methylcytosine-specific restriction endonuclease McrA
MTFSAENSRCFAQGKRNVLAAVVNHKHPISAGGSAMPPDTGLESLCVSCNTAAGRKPHRVARVVRDEELPSWG